MKILDKNGLSHFTQKIKELIGGVNSKVTNLEPTILYENSSGTTGNITLNDNVSNYKYLEFYGYNTAFNQSVYSKYKVSDSKQIVISYLGTNNQQVRILVNGYDASGKILTKKYGYLCVIFGQTINQVDTNRNEITITRILGYK